MNRMLLTPEEAADALSVGRTTIYALLRDGALCSVHIGRCRRILQTELERYVAGISQAGQLGEALTGERHVPTPSRTSNRVPQHPTDRDDEAGVRA